MDNESQKQNKKAENKYKKNTEIENRKKNKLP